MDPGYALTAAAQLSTIFAAMSEGLVVQDADGRIIEANQAAETVLGLTRDQLLGLSSMDPQWRAIREDGSVFEGRDHPAMVTLRTGKPVRNQIMGVQVAGNRPRWISINAQPLPRSGVPGAGAVIATFVDVTEQREALARSRALALRLESVREDERREVAHLLHEGIAQELFAIQLSLRQLESEARGRAGVQRAYVELERSLHKCLRDARQIANELHPSALMHLPIEQVLEEYVHRLAALSGLQIMVNVDAEVPALTDEQRLLLFRGAQEALTNVVKHARASTAAVALSATPDRIKMEIIDDGVGISPEDLTKPRALGLLGMRDRVEARGGWMRIERNEAVAGSTLAIVLPRDPAK